MFLNLKDLKAYPKSWKSKIKKNFGDVLKFEKILKRTQILDIQNKESIISYALLNIYARDG